MKVTGYQLREAIKEQELLRDTAARSFAGTLKAFPDETKEAPEAVVAAFRKAETNVSRLQTAQMRYNLAVTVPVLTETMTLAEAIKRVGGEARAEKMWRSAAGPVPDRYGGIHEDNVRDPTQVRATSTITPKVATTHASQAAKRAGAFRQAIATGNAQAVDIQDLDVSLF